MPPEPVRVPTSLSNLFHFLIYGDPPAEVDPVLHASLIKLVAVSSPRSLCNGVLAREQEPFYFNQHLYSAAHP